MTARPDAERPGIVTTTPQALLDRARHLDTGTDPRSRLEALLCVDAARWLAWPDDLPEAREAEARLRAADAPAEDDRGGPAQLLRLDLAARRASAAGDFPAAVQAITALPSGYSVKTTWLRWREAMLRAGRTGLWDRARDALATAVQRHGVPPSETLAALLGQVDLSHWRAETRLLRTVAERFAALAEETLPRVRDLAARPLTAASGRWLVGLGAETAGAELLHRSTEELVLAGRPRRSRLFSRPSPDAAVWLRQTVDRASLADDDDRDVLLLHALSALIHVARRHQARHLLVETLDPLPVRFQRPDVTAAVLAAGALAWLSCGDPSQAHGWLRAAQRLVARHSRGPLVGDVAALLGEWVERTGDPAVLGSLTDLAARFTGDARLALNLEICRLRGLRGDAEPPWDQLASAWRLAKSRHFEGEAAAVAGAAGVLLAWGQRAAGLAVARCALVAGQAEAARVPTHLSPSSGDAEAELASLLEAIRTVRPVPAVAAPTLRMLVREGEVAAAEALCAAAWELLPDDEVAAARLRPAMALARAVADGSNPDLHGAVETAVADEGVRVLERLRTDDPPAHG